LLQIGVQTPLQTPIPVPDADPGMRVVLTCILVVFVILLILMTRSFIRNARELRRDVDKRFADLSVRLADEARSTIKPLLDRDPEDKVS
jgi:predicted Holliday junction resolvase-like endonuclease